MHSPPSFSPRALNFGRQTLVWIAAWIVVVGAGAPVRAEVAPIQRMDGATKARVLAALAALIILGFGMIALVWLGARITQRYRNRTSYFRPTPRPGENDWANKPLSGDPPRKRFRPKD